MALSVTFQSMVDVTIIYRLQCKSQGGHCVQLQRVKLRVKWTKVTEQTIKT